MNDLKLDNLLPFSKKCFTWCQFIIVEVNFLKQNIHFRLSLLKTLLFLPLWIYDVNANFFPNESPKRVCEVSSAFYCIHSHLHVRDGLCHPLCIVVRCGLHHIALILIFYLFQNFIMDSHRE